MAGTLTISTLSDGTNSTSSTNCIQGSAKAWVNFNGSTAAIRSSFNVGSVTKNGTGDYTINFTTAMPDANFSIVATCGEYGVSNGFVTQPGFATGTAKIKTNNIANAATDYVYVCVSVFR